MGSLAGMAFSLVMRKPAKGRTQPYAKFLLHPVLKPARVGLQIATISPVFLRARPFGGFFYLGFIVPLKLTYGGRESSAM
jgi:hypothetical protein